MAVTGPGFIALQVRDVPRATTFYEARLGLTRAPISPPGAVVFTTSPIAFAVREPLPGVDLENVERPGLGVALWMGADRVQQLHDALESDGVRVVQAPTRGPFGLMFTFLDLDGYAVTIHDQG